MTNKRLEKLADECFDELRGMQGRAAYDVILRYLTEVNKINQKEIDSANSDIDNLQINTDRGY
jgi:hypothetical protein